MTHMPQVNRRSFVVGAAASAGGGLSIGLDIPFGGTKAALAQGATPEINAWVVVMPDDTVVIRIARSEMGQGASHGSRATGSRGTRLRLVEGHDGVSDAGPKSCPRMIGVRSEPFPYGAQEFVDLELYLMSRARGLLIETPGVRP